MLDLFYEGGPLFMGILTLLLLITIIAAVRAYLGYKQQHLTAEQLNNKVGIVRSVGILALVLGILGQLLGLYDMFIAIQQMENVAPTLLAGGLKVSMITTLYGLIIFVISLLLTILLKSVISVESE